MLAMSPPLPYILILDDHPLVARGVAEFLRALLPQMEIVVGRGADDVWHAIAQRGAPRLALIDYWLADGPALEAMARLRSHCPQTVICVMSGDSDPHMAERARAAGAQGFVHKQEAPDHFAQAVRALLDGQPWYAGSAPASGAQPSHELPVTPADLGLSARQGEIFALVLQGLPNKRIALQCVLSESTVKEHVSAILQRLGVRTRVEAITQLRGRRLVLPPR